MESFDVLVDRRRFDGEPRLGDEHTVESVAGDPLTGTIAAYRRAPRFPEHWVVTLVVEQPKQEERT